MDPIETLDGLLARIFADASAHPEERAELKALLSAGALSLSQVKEVFDAFAKRTWAAAGADGTISAPERARMQEIARVLGLEHADPDAPPAGRAGDPRRKLKGMLARIFSDATVDAEERAELRAYLSSGALSMPEVRQVVDDFVQTTWKITIADGAVSEVERQRLGEIVKELGLDREALPVDWAKLVS